MEPLFTCHTSGEGLWSRRVADVPILRLEVAYLNNGNFLNSTHGELRTYFDPEFWDIKEHGLIYTDGPFMVHFKMHLFDIGFSLQALGDVDYSEQGMQGINYISMDIGQMFIAECDNLVRFTQGKKLITEIEVNV